MNDVDRIADTVFRRHRHTAARYGGIFQGADIGWQATMEASGDTFRDRQVKQQDCLALLQQTGITTVRLRIREHPSDDRATGHNSTEQTVAMAVRAQRLGMRIMIDVHDSDSWAYPQQQRKPAAWAGHSFTPLRQDALSGWGMLKQLFEYKSR